MMFPSSHVSLPTTMNESLQMGPMTDPSVPFVTIFHPCSIQQVALHPSPFTAFPSSQFSTFFAMTLSPHVVVKLHIDFGGLVGSLVQPPEYP